ncbi:MAG: FtsW/RodA/SpoVE family cell cycle protein, partial [Vulcanibacillus sp.]
VPLPFISAGGSSLIVSMISIGVILSLSREN